MVVLLAVVGLLIMAIMEGGIGRALPIAVPLNPPFLGWGFSP
jgi:hypothetical protein